MDRFFDAKTATRETSPPEGEQFSRPEGAEDEEPENQPIPAVQSIEQLAIPDFRQEAFTGFAGWRHRELPGRVLRERLLFDGLLERDANPRTCFVNE
jgi:hypothetical protein